ncbi:MAG: ECF transporter S component [Bacillota bacterium]
MKTSIKHITLGAMFLGIAYVLPYLTGNVLLGKMLLPMHLPVLLCGFVCGWPWGLAVGFLAPILRSLLIGMPSMMPTAVAMAFELAAYGAFAGLIYHRLSKTTVNLYVSLALSMLMGRVVWGIVTFVLYSLFLTDAFTLPMFFAGAFINAWPGIIVQIVLIPLLVLALKRMKLMAK